MVQLRLRKNNEVARTVSALERDCMAPENTISYCKFSDDRYDTFAKRRRYDQSVINILLAWANKFDITKYIHNAGNALVYVISSC